MAIYIVLIIKDYTYFFLCRIWNEKKYHLKIGWLLPHQVNHYNQIKKK